MDHKNGHISAQYDKTDTELVTQKNVDGSVSYILCFIGEGDFRKRYEDCGMSDALKAWDSNPEHRKMLCDPALSQMGVNCVYDVETNQSCLSLVMAGREVV